MRLSPLRRSEPGPDAWMRPRARRCGRRAASEPWARGAARSPPRGRTRRATARARAPPRWGRRRRSRRARAEPIAARGGSAASTPATSSRGTSPRSGCSARRTRPVPCSSCSHTGRTTVQARSLAMSSRSASAFARRYTANTSSPPGGSSAPRELTMTYRSTSAARAAWSSLIAPSRSTVSLRSAPLPGPAPAAKTTASAPLIAPASSSAPARSRSQTTGSLPSARRSST